MGKPPTVVNGDIRSLAAFFHSLKKQVEEADLGVLDFTEEPIGSSIYPGQKVVWEVVVCGAEDSISSPAAIIDFYDHGLAVAWNTNDYFARRCPSDKHFSWEQLCKVVRRFYQR
jgi:hypothetical protein